jgi:hypothetical protein
MPYFPPRFPDFLFTGLTFAFESLIACKNLATEDFLHCVIGNQVLEEVRY